MKKLLSTIAILVMSTVVASATLVGSLHIDANIDTNNVDSISGLATRTGNGDENTRGTVEGAFSFLAAYTNGHSSGYAGMNISTFSVATRFNDMDRYAGGPPTGILVWDFDLSGQATNEWVFKVDCDTRRTGDPVPDEWYISFTGLGRTLDTTDATTLTNRDSAGYSLITDLNRYVKIGDLPAGVAGGVYTWDLTEIMQAAISNGGNVRLVYSCDGYYDDIRFINDSGLIATNIPTGTEVYLPKLLVSDLFETGTGSATNNDTIANGWITAGGGSELKEYNVASSGILNIRDAVAPEGTNAVHAGVFDGVQIQFEPLWLAEVGDWLELSVDVGCYEDTSGASIFDVNNPMACISLVDSTRTSEAGYGFRAKRRAGLYSKLVTYNGALSFPQNSDTWDGSRTATTTNGVLQTWKLRIERIEGDNYEIIPSLDGQLFGSGKDLIVTNNLCLNAYFDTLSILPRGNDIGIKIDNVYIATNVELTPYEKWALASGLTASNSAQADNPDLDALDNWGEYVFGGDPTNGVDIGIQPSFDVSGGFVYTVRNNTALNPSILTSDDLVVGSWTTNAADPVASNNGGLGSYTNGIGTAESQQFYKLLVE